VKTALLRFAPAFTPLIVDDAKLVREYMVERGALVPMSYQKPIPVLVNHDESRQIGTVREIAIYDEVISGSRTAPYYVAHVDITEPTAMRRGDGVSWAYHPLHTMELAGTKLIRRALILEVSVLTPAMKPAEALARVVWVGEKQTSSPAAGATTSDRASSPARVQEARGPRFRDALDDYGVGDGDDLEASIAKKKRSPLDRLYDEHIAAKRAKPQVLVRHGVGQVLGVR